MAIVKDKTSAADTDCLECGGPNGSHRTTCSEHPGVTAVTQKPENIYRDSDVVRMDARRELNDYERAAMRAVKVLGQGLIDTLADMGTRSGSSRELSLAKTRAEEAVMWAVKHITR